MSDHNNKNVEFGSSVPSCVNMTGAIADESVAYRAVVYLYGQTLLGPVGL